MYCIGNQRRSIEPYFLYDRIQTQTDTEKGFHFQLKASCLLYVASDWTLKIMPALWKVLWGTTSSFSITSEISMGAFSFKRANLAGKTVKKDLHRHTYVLWSDEQRAPAAHPLWSMAAHQRLLKFCKESFVVVVPCQGLSSSCVAQQQCSDKRSAWVNFQNNDHWNQHFSTDF